MSTMRASRLYAAVLIAGVANAFLLADEWPQWRGPNRDGVWPESGIIERFEGPEIKLRWRAEVAGGYSGPTVAGGRVFVTDRVVEPQERERVHAFDWETGTRLWTHAYPCDYSPITYRAGPRASVTIHEGRAYALGAVGHFLCLDAATGEVRWKKGLADQYQARIPQWGIAAAPLVEDGLVIVHVGGRPAACLIAFDAKTGDERWTALDDPASYSAPIVIDQAGRRVLVCWTGDRVVGLDPRSGDVHWAHPFQRRQMVIGVASPVRRGDRLFVSGFYDGSLMLRLDRDRLAVGRLWRRTGVNERMTDALHALIVTPHLAGDYVYGVDSYGQLRCLDADTGDRIWEDRTATSQARWGTLHMVQNGQNTWMFNDRGELIISRLSPAGFHELSRAHLLDPTRLQLNRRSGVTWSHPAFAYRHVFARNDEELVCASLAKEE
jgi:outer membrane protein assembly factor BamB